MFKEKHKRQSMMFMALLIIGMILFATVGATFAYFQVEKAISESFKIGSVGANWFNGTDLLTNSTTYELALNRELSRGDTAGTYITNVAGTADGYINIRSADGAENQYLRFKAKATIGKNLFDASTYTTRTANGITIQYLEDEDCFLLNGTSTATGRLGDVLSINLEGAIDCSYTVSTSYVSGTVSHSTSEKYVSTNFYTKSDLSSSSSSWLGTNLKATDNSSTGTLEQKYIADFAFYAISGVTLQNYKVKVQLEKSSTATSYESYIDEEDVSSYLTFRYISGSNTFVVGTDTFWKKGTDGYYYYINTVTNNQLQGSGMAYVFNNIVLSGEYPSAWLGRSMKIEFTFESLQYANKPVVSVWGAPAGVALGIS